MGKQLPDAWSSSEIAFGYSPEGPWVQLSDYQSEKARADAVERDAERYRYGRARCLDGSRAADEAHEALRNARTDAEFDAAFDLAIEMHEAAIGATHD